MIYKRNNYSSDRKISEWKFIKEKKDETKYVFGGSKMSIGIAALLLTIINLVQNHSGHFFDKSPKWLKILKRIMVFCAFIFFCYPSFLIIVG